MGFVVQQDWYYSPSEGEVSIHVNGLSTDEIRLVEKAIRDEVDLADGARVLFVEDPEGGVDEWWIYRTVAA